MQKNLIFLPLLLILLISCTNQPQQTMQQQHTNTLINETSPYLLQHAHNPVNWYAWNPETLEKAKKGDKPIILSIGYSSCHWCHVMEKESFENESIAEIMNKHFICIKVDREERPDIDQIYMDALQTMGQNGGWPLNMFLTPDAKPFYGGTYFQPQHWTKICENVAEVFKNQRQKIEESANKITQGLNDTTFNFNSSNQQTTYNKEYLDIAAHELSKKFDDKHGGIGSAPKFPMPNNYLFLLRYYHISKDEKILKHIENTLEKMAFGGIYDQIGGGFARYSTDNKWFAPHFEKMLYDNGQLVSLYSEAYRLTKNDLYKDVVSETITFVERELTHPDGGFYSSLDADSEGEEGKYYCWNEDELKSILKTDFELFKQYYNTTSQGNWEHKNILYRNQNDEKFAQQNNITLAALKEKTKSWKTLLLVERERKIKPALDDKILASWNGLMLSGLVDAYRSFDDEKYLEMAIKNAEFIKKNMLVKGKLMRNYKNGKTSIHAYLEDYAIIIQAFIQLYQITFDEQWIELAKTMTNYCVENFYDEKEQLFFFTDKNSEQLIARKKEIFDNVIPASNSIMANNLFYISKFFDDEKLMKISEKMLSKVLPLAQKEAKYLSNWVILYTLQFKPLYEVAIIGKNAQKHRAEMDKIYQPFLVYLSKQEKEKSTIPLLENKTEIGGKTTIYVCVNKTCKIPVNTTQEAIKQIKN